MDTDEVILRDRGGSAVGVGDRVAYATLTYGSAYLRTGTVSKAEVKDGYGGRKYERVLVKGDHGTSSWQSADTVLVLSA